MRAITVSQFGESPALTEIATPVAGPGQVLIRLLAAGINPMDVKLASGDWRPAPAVFPMVLGVDGAGEVEAVGEDVVKFSRGDKVFGQLFVPPIGSSGTYADFVAVTAEAPLALVPDGLDPIVAAATPTAGATGLSLVELVEPVEDKLVLIVGAGGGVGTFATQFAVNAGARVIADVHAAAAERIESYGVEEWHIDAAQTLTDDVRDEHPDGIDVLIDLVSNAETFSRLASLVRSGGVAVTTQYVADSQALDKTGIRGVNFALSSTSELLGRVGQALVNGTIAAPPITEVSLESVPSLYRDRSQHRANGKTVIVL